MFVGRIDNDISLDDLKEYVTENFDVQLKGIEQLKIKMDDCKAFKLTVLMEDRVKLFIPELWPEDVIIDKYYNKSKRSQ